MTDGYYTAEQFVLVAKDLLADTSRIMKVDHKVPVIISRIAALRLDLRDPDDYEFVSDIAHGLMVLEALRAITGLTEPIGRD